MAIGRPTKLTPTLIEQVEALVSELPHLDILAGHLCIHPSTLLAWTRKGEAEQKRLDNDLDPDSDAAPFLRFSVAVKRGLVDLYRTCLKKVKDGHVGWQSAAWVLERRWPEMWGVSSPEIRAVHRELKKVVKQQSGAAAC